ncbi:PREDICTED: NADH dehydrogenase [ubiquinone] 1 alpha subcomplex assembly factor 3 [Dinoponera quadriceps]|uniref:NADH dehydrogenase [ubiquinone] 1 alpha subcomplex assembly factor 3 n=1 Tax=Dinoponera quadriceps TaxID=609295 RepID=A0A6P3XAM3_DINQU|nr:PREDICTED: NADH dehydrogenase [ubiquinone] 1 alpha subcomplex assembly factor 3 [Dinoponera quadriceps]
MNLTGKLCPLIQALRSCRNLHIASLARNAAAYDGPGKTTVTFISKEIGPRFQVSQCNENGFALSNGFMIVGPTVLFPSQALCWNISSAKYINDATLSLFTVLEPKPELLIIGLDDNYDLPYFRSLQKLMRKHNIISEILPVRKACTVFNFVNDEGRYVIAALIPPKTTEHLTLPKKIEETDSDELKNGRKRNIVETDTKQE